MLKPCPFCGELPEVITAEKGPYKGFTRAYHRCPAIGYIQICDWKDEITEEHFAAWNTRADEERIRRETIEECAEVAETHFSETTWHLGETEPMTIMREIANEIRALAEPKEAEDGN